MIKNILGPLAIVTAIIIVLPIALALMLIILLLVTVTDRGNPVKDIMLISFSYMKLITNKYKS
jgi:hypothetical protein